MYCPECGTYNEEKARFCRICGTRLAEDTEKQKEGGAPVIPAKKKKKKSEKYCRAWLTAAGLYRSR